MNGDERILFDPLSEDFLRPRGCVKENEPILFSLLVPLHCRTRSVSLLLEEDGAEAPSVFPLSRAGCGKEGYERFSGEVIPKRTGLYFYWFFLSTEGSDFRLFRLGTRDTNIEAGEKWQLSVLDPSFSPPASFFGSVFYQIFPDRFAKEGECDLSEKMTPFTVLPAPGEGFRVGPDENGRWNNEFCGGNLRGITSRLPYLSSLGVSALYLNPIFKAYSNHRYDTADYGKIDPMLGNEDDLRELCGEAKKRGIRVILDGVFSHVGEDSVYFDKYGRFGGGAYQNPASRYRDWFSFGKTDDEYDCWWDVLSLPCVNENDPSFSDFVVGEGGVIDRWMRKGVGGFRLDVADELPDSFIARVHDRVRRTDPEGLVLGEVWEDASNKISYGTRRRYFTGAELDGVMNYPFREAILGLVTGTLAPEAFVSAIETILGHYPFPALLCSTVFLSTHDTPRVRTVLEEALSPERVLPALKLASALQFYLPGSPCVYYGDEVGMRGGSDPFNRRFFSPEDGAETILLHHRLLGALRAAHPALRAGDLSLSYKEGTLTLLRTLGEDRAELRADLNDLTFTLA